MVRRGEIVKVEDVMLPGDSDVARVSNGNKCYHLKTFLDFEQEGLKRGAGAFDFLH